MNKEREIKFKVWDNGWDCYLKDNYAILPDGRIIFITRTHQNYDYVDIVGYPEHSLSDNDRFIVLEYTGFKDKNNKEIYDGDIILSSKGNKWKIEWESDIKMSPAWRAISIGETKDAKRYYGVFSHGVSSCKYLNQMGFKKAEVIGNIYENPDLIK